MTEFLTQIKPNLEKILLFVVFLFLLTAAITLNKPGLFYLMAIFFVVFFFFKDFLWLAPVLALPALTAGEVLQFELTPYWHYDYTISEALLLLALAVFLLDKFLKINLAKAYPHPDESVPGVKIDYVSFFLLLYFALAVSSYWQIIDLHYYLFGLKAIFFGFAGYFLALNLINTKTKLQASLYSLTATLLILAIQVFYKFYQLGFSEKFFFERKLIILPLGPLATVASIVAMLIPVVFIFFLAEKKLQIKALILPAFCFGLFALFVSLGKAAILASLIAIVYLNIRLKKVRPYFLAALILGSIVGAVFLAPLASGLVTRIRTTFTDINTQYRVLEYRTAGRLISNHLFFGVGAGQQLFYFKKLLNFDTSELVNNFFLQALLDFGLLGLAGTMAIVLSMIKKSLEIYHRSSGSSRILACGLMAMLLTSLVTGVLEVTFFALPYAIIFWLTAGILVNSNYYGND